MSVLAGKDVVETNPSFNIINPTRDFSTFGFFHELKSLSDCGLRSERPVASGQIGQLGIHHPRSPRLRLAAICEAAMVLELSARHAPFRAQG